MKTFGLVRIMSHEVVTLARFAPKRLGKIILQIVATFARFKSETLREGYFRESFYDLKVALKKFFRVP